MWQGTSKHRLRPAGCNEMCNSQRARQYGESAGPSDRDDGSDDVVAKLGAQVERGGIVAWSPWSQIRTGP
jgi:hypothetical protein